MADEIIVVACDDGESYAVRLLHEFGSRTGSLTPQKVADLWAKIRKHEVLFSDQTMGQAEPFLAILFNPASVWLEIVRVSDEEVIGVIYISSVIPNFDAKGHFVVFDGVASKRRKIFWDVMNWMFVRYNLHRISAEAPPYQGGVLRFVKRHLCMKQEGERREAVVYKNRWWPLIEFGILRQEFEGLYTVPQDVQSLNTSEV